MFKNNLKYLIIASSIFLFLICVPAKAVNYGSGIYGNSLYSASLSSIYAITATPGSNAAQISFSTSQLTSVSINYGLTSNYSASTTETDLSPLTLSHNIGLSNLSICTTYHYNIKVRDIYSNEVTSADQIFTTTGCSTLSESSIYAITATPSSNAAQISFSTSQLTSVSINYGLTSNYSASTTETDLSPLTLSHNIGLSNLSSCTTYHYNIKLRDIYLNEYTSSDKIFTTNGCTASSDVSESGSSQIDKTTGGTLILKDGSLNGLTLSIPIAFATSSANFQAHKLDRDTVLNIISTPRYALSVGDYIYELKALSSPSSTISVFNNPLTISITYSANDISGLDESSLKIYRWDGGAWNQLSNCSVNTNTKTVTCETNHFSTFGLFGQQISINNPTSSSPVIKTPCSSLVYDSWQETCVNGKQFRNILSQAPNFCSLTSEQRALTKRACGGVINLENNENPAMVDSITSVYKYERSALAKIIDKKLSAKLAGRILLQVETNGQAWYLDPKSLNRYYLADGFSAYQALRQFGLGIINKDLNQIPVAPTSVLPSDYNKSINYSKTLTNRLRGKILLQVENRGEAWYLNPQDGYRYYLANGEAAYQIMKKLSLGITNENIWKIAIGEFK